MEVKQSFLTNNPRYKQKKIFTPKGLMLHSVGVPQPKASVFISQWNKADYRKSCVHGIIDANDGIVYQTLPWNYKGWHGGGSSNDTHIGVEMGETSSITYLGGATIVASNLSKAKADTLRTYQSAVELFAMLCKQFNLNPLTQICSHSEGHKKGIATNHADPEHLWNQLNMGLTMDKFRADVQKAITGASKPTSVSFSPYKVRVTIADLNIRMQPTASSVSRGYIAPGVYTIIEEQNGWGLLKAYGAKKDGWISLRYAVKV